MNDNLDFEQRHRIETEVLPAVIDDPEYAAATIVRLESRLAAFELLLPLTQESKCLNDEFIRRLEDKNALISELEKMRDALQARVKKYINIINNSAAEHPDDQQENDNRSDEDKMLIKPLYSLD